MAPTWKGFQQEVDEMFSVNPVPLSLSTSPDNRSNNQSCEVFEIQVAKISIWNTLYVICILFFATLKCILYFNYIFHFNLYLQYKLEVRHQYLNYACLTSTQMWRTIHEIQYTPSIISSGGVVVQFWRNYLFSKRNRLSDNSFRHCCW